MDLHENPEANSVTATFELPGFNKDDVQIDVYNGKLTVAVENEISTEREQSGVRGGMASSRGRCSFRRL